VCAAREGLLARSGSVIYPGTRRPLFTAAGGVAILQALPVAEARAVLVDNVAQEIARCGTSRLAGLQRMRERSDRHGFGVNLGDVVPGIHAVAVPVRDAHGRVFASLSLLGTSAQFGEPDLPALHDALRDCAQRLEDEACRLGV
jgi:DNA-binding IclR family transcriptional regulator